MFYTYVLKNKKDNKFYVGLSRDLRKRLARHNHGLVPSTKYRRSLELVYYEACLDEEKSVKREQYFKTGFGRKFLKDRI